MAASAIKEINIPDVLPTIKDELRSLISAEFWNWYGAHRDDKVTTIKWWMLKKTVYVRDLRPVFVMLFGDNLTFA